MSLRTVAVVPARLPSRRFPGKVLHQWRGKPLLFYVWREMTRVPAFDRLIIATDSSEIRAAVEDFGGEAIMTSKRHRTGSDRVAEAVAKIGGDVIVNIQADNFGLRSAGLQSAVRKFIARRDLKYGTLARRITSETELSDHNVVKVAVAGDGIALWFSRLPIPYFQADNGVGWSRSFPYWHHIGVYLFRKAGLEKYAALPRSPLEKAESLEQLRILEAHERMEVFKTRMRSVSVDSPRDVAKLATLYR